MSDRPPSYLGDRFTSLSISAARCKEYKEKLYLSMDCLLAAIDMLDEQRRRREDPTFREPSEDEAFLQPAHKKDDWWTVCGSYAGMKDGKATFNTRPAHYRSSKVVARDKTREGPDDGFRERQEHAAKYRCYLRTED
jgi:hypothetical protein